MAGAIVAVNQNTATASATVSVSVARAAGEALVACVWQENDWTAVGTVSSVVWDSGGDNQTLASVASQQEGAEYRRLSVYQLSAPTSAKTANVSVTLNASHDRLVAFVLRLSGLDSAGIVRNSNARSESDILANDLPNTVASVAGDYCLFVGSVRSEVAYIDAGDLSEYSESAPIISSRSRFVGTKTATGTSTTGTFGYSDVTSYSNALIALALKLAPAGGGGNAPRAHYYNMMRAA